MTDEKMDMFEFSRFVEEKYGLSEEDAKPLRNLAVVFFETDSMGNCSGRYRGWRVYVGWDYIGVIQPGDMWICELEKNPSGGPNYFATPKTKIDSAFLYDMTKDQIAEFATTLWERHRDMLEPVLADIYRDEVEGRISATVAAETAALRSDMAKLESENSELVSRNQENERIIAGMMGEIEGLRAAKGDPSDSGEGQGDEQSIVSGGGVEGISRMDRDTIGSEFLVHPRYSVYVDADHTQIRFIPNDDGKVVCTGYETRLKGLDQIFPYDGERKLRYEYDPASGELVAYLSRVVENRKTV